MADQHLPRHRSARVSVPGLRDRDAADHPHGGDRPGAHEPARVVHRDNAARGRARRPGVHGPPRRARVPEGVRALLPAVRQAGRRGEAAHPGDMPPADVLADGAPRQNRREVALQVRVLEGDVPRVRGRLRHGQRAREGRGHAEGRGPGQGDRGRPPQVRRARRRTARFLRLRRERAPQGRQHVLRAGVLRRPLVVDPSLRAAPLTVRGQVVREGCGGGGVVGRARPPRRGREALRDDLARGARRRLHRPQAQPGRLRRDERRRHGADGRVPREHRLERGRRQRVDARDDARHRLWHRAAQALREGPQFLHAQVPRDERLEHRDVRGSPLAPQVAQRRHGPGERQGRVRSVGPEAQAHGLHPQAALVRLPRLDVAPHGLRLDQARHRQLQDDGRLGHEREGREGDRPAHGVVLREAQGEARLRRSGPGLLRGRRAGRALRRRGEPRWQVRVD